MRKRKLFWQLFPTYFLTFFLGSVVLIGATWFLFKTNFENYLNKNLQFHLKQVVKIIDFSNDRESNLLILKELNATGDYKYTLVYDDLTTAGYFEKNLFFLKSEGILDAFEGNLSNHIFSDSKTDISFIVSAAPLRFQFKKAVSVIAVSVPIPLIYLFLESIYSKVFIIWILTSIIVIWILYNYIKKLSSAIERLKSGADLFAQGRLNFKITLPPTYLELKGLAFSMNRMSSQLLRLENIRKDFVANVSHELKTPITSIKGFVETLLDGASETKEDIERFLRIILKHTNRLNSIIEDLLVLSKIEKGDQNSTLEFEKIPLKPILQTSVVHCEDVKNNLKSTIKIECDESVLVYANSHLLEQAISNLIGNAIKYSGSEKPIILRANIQNRYTVVEVIDFGKGIPKEHLDRLFERFYRVDSARSRKLGGTGLGLSIVKHIAQAHQGYVEVESESNKGSKFSIFLPQPQ